MAPAPTYQENISSLDNNILADTLQDIKVKSGVIHDEVVIHQSKAPSDTDDDYLSSPSSDESSEFLRSCIQQQAKQINELQQKVQQLLEWKLTAVLPTPPGSPSNVQSDVQKLELSALEPTLAEKIIKIIAKYGCHVNATHVVQDGNWPGKVKFLPIVEEQINLKNPIRMVLPAFPFKSPNTKEKVIGRLPDLGEEIALAHLQGLCESIADIWEYGAEVIITSDGLVYNDLLGVSDEDVWNYGEALRAMAQENDFCSIKFYRLFELLEYDSPVVGKDEYLLHAGCFRRELIGRYGEHSFDWRRAIRESEDTCLTYRGYLKFLTDDMRYQPQMTGLIGRKYKGAVEAIAQKMIVRGRAFANAVEHKFGNCVRLSIHASTGEKKLSVPLIPQQISDVVRTPWHSSIAVGVDGTFQTVHPADVRDTHDLVLRDGHPYCFREKSELYNWSPLEVEFQHMYPQGLIISAKAGTGRPSLREVDMKKVRELAQLQSPIVVRGFAETTDRELFASKAHEAGEVQQWTFGTIQEVKDHGRNDKAHNNVVSNEAMPMHYDGMFKFVTEKDAAGNEIKIQKPPKYVPLPNECQKILTRWHEPWPSSKTKFSTCDVRIENDSQDIKAVVDDLLYDHRVCLRFSWEQGDILVSDNVAMLHTRTAFTGDCDRELWRIHFN